MNNSHKFGVFLVFMMMLYVWIGARERAHKKIFDFFDQNQQNKMDEDINFEEDTNVLSGSMDGPKSTLLLDSVRSEADWITFRVFIMAIIYMIVLQVFNFFINNIGRGNFESILNLADVNKWNEKATDFRQKFDTKNNSEARSLMSRLADEDDRTFTHLFVKEDTLGNSMIFNIIYQFAMSFKLMILSFIAMYTFNYIYVYFVVRDDEFVTEDALHMHVDIMMFVALIILTILLIYLAIEEDEAVSLKETSEKESSEKTATKSKITKVETAATTAPVATT